MWLICFKTKQCSCIAARCANTSWSLRVRDRGQEERGGAGGIEVWVLFLSLPPVQPWGHFLIFNLGRTAPSLVYNSHSYYTEEGNGMWLQIQLKIVFPSSHNPHTALKPLSSTDIQFSLLSMGLPLLGRWAVARGQAGPWTKGKTEGTHLSWNPASGSPESHGLPTFLVFLLGFEAIPTPQETPRLIWPTLFSLC